MTGLYAPSNGGTAMLPPALLIALMSVAAVLFGLVAVTADPIVIALAVGLFAGALLLAKPSWNIWLVLTLGLLVAGVIPIWADVLASKAVWGISVLGFVLMASALFRAATTPNVPRNTPAFVWLALTFLLYAVFSTLMQWHSAFEFFSSFKRYFQVFGLLFALTWLVIEEADVRRWLKLFIIVALVQLPFAVYQLVKLVPLRESFRHAYSGLVPIDVVAGTFGSYLYQGGANAEMATFLIIVLAFLLARLREKALPTRRAAVLVPLVLAPLFMGETKVVVLLLPLMFAVLYRRELLAKPHHALMGLVFGALLTGGALFTYVAVTKAKTLQSLVQETLSYNIGQVGHGGRVLNRTTALKFWAEKQGMHDPVSAVVGNGMGSSHDATGGHLATRYPGYGIGITAATTLLWDLGLVGMLLYLAMLIAAWRTAGQLRSCCTDPKVRADASAIQAVMALFAFYLIYRIALLESLGFQIVFAALLGYLAWLKRKYLPNVPLRKA